MPRSNAPPESLASGATRMTTRSKNATAHPGAVLQNPHSRRSKKEVEEEKRLRNVRKEAKLQKQIAADARKAKGELRIAQLEAIQDEDMEQDYPRRQRKQGANKDVSKGKSHAQTTRRLTSAKYMEKVMEIADAPIDETTVQQAKRAKTGKKYPNEPLCRTETYLSIDKSKPQEMVSTDEEDESEPQEMVVSTDEEDELTPRPKKKESRDQSLPIDNDLEDEPFETPLVLRHHKKRHPRVVVDSDDKAEPTKMPFKRKREVEEKTRVRGDGTEGQVIINQPNPLPHKSAQTHAPFSSQGFAYTKVDLTKVLAKHKPQSYPSRSNDTERARDIGPDVEPAWQVRTTASSGIVAAKASSKAIAPVERRKPIANPSLEDSAESDGSEEDDSREREVAMSSPLRGSELRATTKSLVKVKAIRESKPQRMRATALRLPMGANDEDAWATSVIPNFINIVLAGNHPWIITDDTIIAALQQVWDYTYGSNLEFEIKRGTVPFNLIMQKLCDYRNKLGVKAIWAVMGYFCSENEIGDETFEDLRDDVAEFARALLEHDIPQAFIFKGAENIAKPKRTGTFQHQLVIETLSAHFSHLTQGKALNGIQIGKPRLAIALAAAAVERALHLLANKNITEQGDSKGRGRFVVEKMANPRASNSSKCSLEFSAAGWNQVTLDYFDSVKKLTDGRLTQIFDEAMALSKCKSQSAIQGSMPAKSSRAMLQSDEEEE